MTWFRIILITLVIGYLPPADLGAKNIKMWHRTSIYLDGNNGSLFHPEGVACATDSHLLVADSGNGRLLRYRLDPESVPADPAEIKLPQLRTPTKIETGRNSEIYVLNRQPLQIVRLTADGRFLSIVRPAGIPAAVPKSFAVHPSGDLYVVAPAEKKVLVMTPGGTLRERIDFPAGADFLSDIAVDSRGRVLVVDAVVGIVYALESAGRTFVPITESLKPYARYPSALTTDAGGRIFLSDRNASRIVVLSSGGGFLGRLSGRGWKEGLLQYPSQVCISGQSRLSVADTLNNRVQVFEVTD